MDSLRNENLNLLVRIKFLNLFNINISKLQVENLLTRTKFDWSWVEGTVLIMRTVDKTSEHIVENKNKKNIAKDRTIQSPQETGSKMMSFNIPNLKNYLKNTDSG